MNLRKYCDNQARYCSELSYRSVFSDLGYIVPELIASHDSDRIIEYKRIIGRGVGIGDEKMVVDTLVKIYQQREEIINDISDDRCKKEYLELVQYILGLYSVDNYYVARIVELMDKHWQLSIFKDAKPENWLINQEERLVMLDFDYVVPSIFYQDLAQFLTGIWINCKQQDVDLLTRWSRYFFYKTVSNPDSTNMGEYNECFTVACIVSTTKKIEYSRYKSKLIDKIKRLEVKLVSQIKEKSQWQY